jgi:D-glycero-D-manno-heptose 1,7-bisphosphate phosphatase
MLPPPLLETPTPQRHLFLDRDGTLIRECHFLRDPGKIFFEYGAIDGLLLFQNAGYRLVIVSNQSGIARSLITYSELESITSRISELLGQENITIDSWHYCPHLPNQGCFCRKPSTALFQDADKLHPVDWHHSLMVGDKISDIEAGIALGLRPALVTTGYGLSNIEWAQQRGILIVSSLRQLAYEVLNEIIF